MDNIKLEIENIVLKVRKYDDLYFYEYDNKLKVYINSTNLTNDELEYLKRELKSFVSNDVHIRITDRDNESWRYHINVILEIRDDNNKSSNKLSSNFKMTDMWDDCRFIEEIKESNSKKDIKLNWKIFNSFWNRIDIVL